MRDIVTSVRVTPKSHFNIHFHILHAIFCPNSSLAIVERAEPDQRPAETAGDYMAETAGDYMAETAGDC